MESEHEFYSLLLFFFHAVSSNTCFRRALRRWLGRKSWLTRDSRGLFKCFLDLTVNTSPQQSHKSLHLPHSSIHPTTKALWHPQSCIFFFLSPSVSFATPKLSDGKIVRGVNGIEFRVKKKSLKALFMAVFCFHLMLWKFCDTWKHIGKVILFHFVCGCNLRKEKSSRLINLFKNMMTQLKTKHSVLLAIGRVDFIMWKKPWCMPEAIIHRDENFISARWQWLLKLAVNKFPATYSALSLIIVGLRSSVQWW